MFDVEKVLGKKREIRHESEWTSTCEECGGIMEYSNLRYCCIKCGNILEV